MLDSKKEIKKTLAVTERNNQTNVFYLILD
jgi:hypothetical protein